MPRAAMSVATSTRYVPSLNPLSAAVRWACERLPWMRSALTPFFTRYSARRLARCLVRVKTSASFMSPRCSSARKSADFSSWCTGYTACVMPTAGCERRSRLIEAGFLSISRASAPMGPGMVALKNSVCLRGGRCLRMRLMSGRNPMSSIRSASSSTRYSRCASLAYGWRKWSSSRPGVATMTSTPVRNACSCGPMPMPPNTAAAVMGVCTATSLRSSTIWAASSRVGVITSARVTPRFSSIRWCRMGSRKASVLPLPVWAQARRSRPSRAGGMASSWMGVGRVKPSSLSPRWREACNFNEAKATGCSEVRSGRCLPT